MAIRRKTKTERELVADINKAFTIFCNRNSCVNCKFNDAEDCKLEYVKELLKIENEEEE